MFTQALMSGDPAAVQVGAEKFLLIMDLPCGKHVTLVPRHRLYRWKRRYRACDEPVPIRGCVARWTTQICATAFRARRRSRRKALTLDSACFLVFGDRAVSLIKIIWRDMIGINRHHFDVNA